MQHDFNHKRFLENQIPKLIIGVIIIIILCLVSLCTKAQVQIDSVNPSSRIKTIGSVSKADLSYAFTGSDTVYALYYRDETYKALDIRNKILFSATSQDIDNLYLLLKTFFTKENKGNEKYTRSIKLGDKTVLLSALSVFSDLVVISTKDGYFSLTERQVDKLFGKK